jgi:hypothetical protein
MPSVSVPKQTQRHTLLAVFYGVILFVWLMTENASMVMVSVLGLGTALGITGLSVLHWWGGRTFRIKIWLPSVVVLGVMVGFGATGATFLLMMFKNVQHSHVVADYPWESVTDMLMRAPSWMVAGGLLGAAIGLGIVAWDMEIGRGEEIEADGHVEALT